MNNPWKTGEVFKYGGQTIPIVICDAQSRLVFVQQADSGKLIEIIAWPDTQKTVRAKAVTRLRRLLKQDIQKNGKEPS